MAGIPGIPVFIAGRAVGAAIGRGVAVGAIVGVVGAAGLPESPTPLADAVATVVRTEPASEAATNTSLSLRMIYPLVGPRGRLNPLAGRAARDPRQMIDRSYVDGAG